MGAEPRNAFMTARRDLTDWLARFRSGASTVEDYIDHLHGLYEGSEPDLQAFACVDWLSARMGAREATARYRAGCPLSAIDGMPIGVKDIIETAGLPMEMQSAIFAGHYPRRNADCVMKMLRLGAIVVGKTRTQEMACGIPGPTRNPYDLRRTPGGSSSGSAAAVAAGILPFTIGTHTRGSTIRPASYCGVYAIKPTFGWISLDGVHPVAPSHDTIGFFAASLRDLRLVLETFAGRPLDYTAPRPKRLLAIRTSGMSQVEPGVERTFRDFLDSIEELEVHGWDSPAAQRLDAAFAGADDLLTRIISYEIQWPYGDYLERMPNLLSPEIAKQVANGRAVSDEAYAGLLSDKRRIQDVAAAAAEGYDAVVTLSSAGIAPIGLRYSGSRSFAIPWALVGGPSLSTPLLTYQGMPLGVQIMAQPGKEDTCFAVAQMLERASG